MAILLTATSACQQVGEATPAPTSTIELEASIAPAPSETQPPAESATPQPAVPTNVLPTITSPIPTATRPATPTPLPELTLYTVQPGDTLFSIAEQFDVALDALLYGNGYASLDDAQLIAGGELQIPLCEMYRVAPGNTLSGISQFCEITLDDLVLANITALAPLGNLDAVPVGFVLVIPQGESAASEPDCTAGPAREQVIEYTPQPNEGIFCLSQKFGVSATSLIQGNIQRLVGNNVYGEQPLLIPPVDGALYVFSAEDLADGVTVNDIADWYGVAVESVLDWNGNRVTDLLHEGQQLLVSGANLLAGPFRAQTPGQEDQANGQS